MTLAAKGVKEVTCTVFCPCRICLFFIEKDYVGQPQRALNCWCTERFRQLLHFKRAPGLAGNMSRHESTVHIHPPLCIPGRCASSYSDNIRRRNLFHFHHNHPFHSSIHQRTTLYSLRCENEPSLGAHVSWIPGRHKAGGSGLPASLFASCAPSSHRPGFREGVKCAFFFFHSLSALN